MITSASRVACVLIGASATVLVAFSGCGGSGNATGSGGSVASASSVSGGPGSTTTGSVTSTVGGGGATSSSTSGSGGGSTNDGCPPLAAPSGKVIHAGPADVANLRGIVASATTGDTVLLDDGTYPLAGDFLPLAVDGVTLRSASGDATKVIIDGAYITMEIVRVTASNITVADLTITRPVNHAIHVASEQGADIKKTLIYDVRVIDPGEQGIKINSNDGTHFTDDGTVACSTIELTDVGRPMVVSNSGGQCYTGGIDAHESKGWVIRDNHISGFWCPVGLSEHGVHFWSGSRDTTVERNTITNCARGVGFGLQQVKAGRNYADDPCPGVTDAGHYGGMIRNNFVFANDAGLFASQGGFDTGIGFEQACGVIAAHNTVASTTAPFADVDVRFDKTSATLVNNLFSADVRVRDGGVVKTDVGNVAMAPASLFVDANQGDLHLVASASQAIDQGAAGAMTLNGAVTDDIDGDARDAKPDLGADEKK